MYNSHHLDLPPTPNRRRTVPLPPLSRVPSLVELAHVRSRPSTPLNSMRSNERDFGNNLSNALQLHLCDEFDDQSDTRSESSQTSSDSGDSR